MVQLSDELARMAEQEMRDGHYSSIDEVLRAALTRLRWDRQEASTFGDFKPGELAALVEVGLKDFREGRVVSHETLVAEMQRLSEERRQAVSETTPKGH